MKRQKGSLCKYAGALALSLGVPVMLVGQTFAATPTSKVYSTDGFGVDYSSGVLFRDPTFGGTGNPMKVTLPDGGIASSELTGLWEGSDLTCYNNTTKGSYVTIENGAIYDGEYLDVREYIWVDGSASLSRYWCYRNPASDGSVESEDGTPTTIVLYRGAPAQGQESVSMMDIANIELHFYDKSGDEVEFHGVVGMDDFEVGEQYKLLQGGGQVYLRQSTVLGYIPANESWGVNPTKSSGSVDGQYDLWVEVDGAESAPLRLQYISEGPYTVVGHYRASAMMMEAVNVTYEIVGDTPDKAVVPEGEIATQYGVIAPASVEEVDGYTFDGWYYDKALTKTVGATTNKLSKDTTLYGKYTKVEDGDEEDEGGAKAPDTGLFTGDSESSKFGGVIAIAGAIAAGLTGYAVYKNRRHLFHKIGFGKKGF